jgi:WD40 repeat protein
LWSFPDGNSLHTLQDRKKTVSAVQISPDGAWVGAGSYGGRARVWTLDGEDVIGIKASKKNLSSIAFSPDVKILATSGLGDDILIWSLPSGEQIDTLSGHKTAAWSLNFIEEGATLASLGYEGSVKFWDTSNWRETRSYQLESPGVRGLTFSPDGETAALSMESQVQLWLLKDWQLLSEIPVSTKVVSSVAFSQDGDLLAIGGADNKIRIWEI